MNKGHFEQLTPEVQAYLERIGFIIRTSEGLETIDHLLPLDKSAATLAQLQECHLHTVPYENFDIMKRIPLSLDIEQLFDKIVTRRRGGYCFETNALFGWLLRELGYEVTDYMARFWRDETDTPPKRRHHVLKVRAEGTDYLCDVGVGGIIPRRPIKMVEMLEQVQGDESYRLERDPYFGWVLCELHREQWRWLYSFTEEPQLAKDFIMSTFWCEHSPDSIFIDKAMVAIRTKQGRNTIADKQFRIFTDKGTHTFIPDSDHAFRDALKQYFGIELP